AAVHASLRRARRPGEHDIALRIDIDRSLLQQAADGALERLLAQAEAGPDLLGRGPIADPGRTGPRDERQDRRGVVFELLVGVLAQRQLDLAIGPDVGHPAPDRLAAPQLVWLARGDQPDERPLDDHD